VALGERSDRTRGMKTMVAFSIANQSPRGPQKGAHFAARSRTLARSKPRDLHQRWRRWMHSRENRQQSSPALERIAEVCSLENPQRYSPALR
jgi:hypothetical protein